MTSDPSTRPSTPSRPIAHAVLGFVCAAGLAMAAHAAPEPDAPPPVAGIEVVAPHAVVVIEDNAPLRAGWTDRHYRVAELAKGQTLRVDGRHHSEWLRVAYPKGVPAFVKPNDATLSRDQKSVTLVRPSKLKALNLRGKAAGSWRSLMTEPLPAGRVLPLREVLTDDTGKVVGYAVTPPARARGYIHAKFVKPAPAHAESTPDDGAAPAVLASPLRAAEPAAPVQPTPDQPSTDQPGPGQPAGADRVDDSLIERMVEPTHQPDQPSTPTDEPTQTDEVATPDAPAHDSPSPAGTPTQAGADTQPTDPSILPGVADESLDQPTPVMTIEALDAAYHRMRQQPTAQAELDELLVQYRRAYDAASDEVFATRLRRQLAQRIAMLELRIKYRDQALTLANQTTDAEAKSKQLDARLAQIEQQRSYDLVGWLMPSTIYDGQRLPLLYRLRSADTLGRTLAYVRPDPSMKLTTKVGSLVGVRGKVTLDPRLGLRIVTLKDITIVARESALVADQP